MSRLVLGAFVLIAALVATATPILAKDDGAAEWRKFRARFVMPDGRVIDTGNHQISHSEGQGWGMLFAETFGDRVTFDRIWAWTRGTLQHKDSALFSWKWDPNDPDLISDTNDASDGDITIAWALSRAGQRWNAPSYTRAAKQIVVDIRRDLICVAQNRLVLLPGRRGFRSDDRTVVNLSYYVFPALTAFSRIDFPTEWQRLSRDGLSLLAEARFGRWGLPPDWLELDADGDVAPAAKLPPRFGFDAVRIPLYLVWAREASPERLATYLDFWNRFGTNRAPGWTDLKDNTIAPFDGSTGFDAVVQLVRSSHERNNPPTLPTIGERDDYYSASLTLLTRIARRESMR